MMEPHETSKILFHQFFLGWILTIGSQRSFQVTKIHALKLKHMETKTTTGPDAVVFMDFSRRSDQFHSISVVS